MGSFPRRGPAGLVLAIGLALAGSLLLTPTTAAASYPIVTGGATSCPRMPSYGVGVCFNDPRTETGRVQLLRELTRLVKQTYARHPKRNSLRIAMYAWRYPERGRLGPVQQQVKRLTDAVVSARARGVNVKVLLDEENAGNIVHRRLDPFHKGVVEICRNDCLIRNRAILHDKVWLFRIAGRPTRVVTTSSNTTPPQQREFQNLVSVAGDPDLWKFYSAYFADMRADRRAHPFQGVGQRLGMKPYGGPLPGLRDPLAEHLSRITRCTRAHHTVRMTTGTIGLARFTYGRKRVSKAISRVHRMGCTLYLVLTRPPSSNAGDDERHALGHLRRLGVHIRLLPRSQPVHNKVVLIDAVSRDRTGHGEARPRLITLTGSMNLTFGAIRYAAENTLRLEGPSVFKAYSANFRLINHYARTS